MACGIIMMQWEKQNSLRYMKLDAKIKIEIKISNLHIISIWVKVFKNEPSKIY